MSAIRQIARGCGTLPFVGPHPGTAFFVVMTVGMTLAGFADTGLLGALSTAGGMLVFFGPFYLHGAYERAQLSDKLLRRDQYGEKG